VKKKKDRMSFYVTLSSQANRKEFPNNQANIVQDSFTSAVAVTWGSMASRVECHFFAGHRGEHF